MTEPLHPALLFMAGALLIPLLPARLRPAVAVLLPLLGLYNLLSLPVGVHWTFDFLDYTLVGARIDKLALVFVYIFHIITFLGMVYILHWNRPLEFSAGFFYAGAALGVVCAGDLLTLFAFWEGLTLGAIGFIFGRGTPESYRAGMRYLLVHVFGGLVLLAGIVGYVASGGGTAFEAMTLSNSSTVLIFIGFGLNAAFPLLHAWIPDAYPKATIGGAVFLSALTTKTAVYALARGFPGTELLVYLGAAMTMFPIFYAVIENDLRSVLAYSLINQVGYMLVGVGLGTELALNGATAHVFTHILYKSLLFMSIGAVMYRTGCSKATELGGLYRSMPFTCICCIVAALSISGFPLFSGFISKSMVVSEAANAHLLWVWFALLFASAGVVKHAGIKIPFFAFFSHDGGWRVKEAPLNMCIAMGIAALLCIILGIFPHQTIYQILPYPVDYEPYTAFHVVAQLELLLFASLAFTLMLLGGIYPAELRCTNLDVDWFYRKGAALFYAAMDRSLNFLNAAAGTVFLDRLPHALGRFAAAGPRYIASLAYEPVLVLMSDGAHHLRKRFERAFEKGTFSIGAGAAAAVVIFAVLYFS